MILDRILEPRAGLEIRGSADIPAVTCCPQRVA